MPRTDKSRTETWLTWIALAIGLPVVGVGSVLYYMSVTKTALHPNAQAVTSVIASAPLPQWTSAVDLGRQVVRAGLVDQNLPGVSVAVGVGQDVVWAEGFGWADVEKRLPATPKTRFRIGHVSKALTSAAVGLLLEKGQLNLDDEIQTVVPEFPRKQWPVTLRQAMAHTAGFRHYPGEYADVPKGHCDRASEGWQAFANDPLLFEPETRSSYSTYGWVLVSAAVEAAAGEPFFKVMESRIFAPLGMTGTLPDSVTESIPDRTTFYFPRFSGDNFFGAPVAETVDYSCFAGAGAFLSTPIDLVRFGIAMNSGTLLQRSTVQMLQTPQQLASGKETEFGLGWTIETVPLAGEPAQVASDASRSLFGGTTSFLTVPDRGIVVVVTTNTSYASTRGIALRIAEAFAESAKRAGSK